MSKRLPTPDEIVEIFETFNSNPRVTMISVQPALLVTVEVECEGDRNVIYELEGKLLEKHPDLLLDFRVTAKTTRSHSSAD